MSTQITLEEFFLKKPKQLQLFCILKKFIESLGSVTMKVTKTQISFSCQKQFAWIWLPQPWDTKRPQRSVVLSFSLDKKVKHPIIVESVESYPGRWMHHLIICTENDLNKEVKGWLEEAYRFGGTKQ